MGGFDSDYQAAGGARKKCLDVLVESCLSVGNNGVSKTCEADFMHGSTWLSVD